VGQHLLALRALDVDDRRLVRDSDRLRHAADLEIRIHGRDKRSRELDPFPLDGAETSQREVDLVGAGAKILDPVLTRAIRHRGANLLDQRGTRGFHRHARKHGAGRVLHHTGDGCLRARQGWD
jgi:hypothetical protein